MATRTATHGELLKLYDIISNADVSLVAKFLNKNKIDINKILPCKEIGVLHLAVGGIDPLEKSKQCTELLLKHGGDPNLANNEGLTPVHIAASWGRLENLKLLVTCGGNPWQRDLDGMSSFHYAVKSKHWHVYSYLIELEARLNKEPTLTADQIDADNQTSPKETTSCEKTSLVVNCASKTVPGDETSCENTSLVVNCSNQTVIEYQSNTSLIVNCSESSYYLEDETPPSLFYNVTGISEIDLSTSPFSKGVTDTQLEDTSTTCEKSTIEHVTKVVSKSRGIPEEDCS